MRSTLRFCFVGFVAMTLAETSLSQEPATPRIRFVADVEVTARPRAFLQLGETGADLFIISRIPPSPSGGPRILTEEEASARKSRPAFDVEMLISLDPDNGTVDVAHQPRPDGAWEVGGRLVQAIDVSRVSRTRRRQPAPGTQAAAEEQYAELDRVQFEDGEGNRVRPNQQLVTYFPVPEGTTPGSWGGSNGAIGLFVIDGERRIEITTPRSQAVGSFEYDSVNRRVLTHGTAEGEFLYDLNTDTRRILVNFDRATKTSQEYHLVPGRDLLVRYERQYTPDGHNYAGFSLYLDDMELQTLTEISLLTSDSEKNALAWEITCSHEMLAFRMGSNGVPIVRIYAFVD